MQDTSSPRLHYRRLATSNLATFHALAIDEHIRRYLLDGEVVDEGWCAAQLQASDALFAERGVGLWLAFLAEMPDTPIGFCGFIRFAETGPEPQLLFALTAEHAGQGYATEMARTLIDFVRRNTRATEIISAVDEPNVASSHVLEKLGFQPAESTPGAFGRIFHYRFPLT